MLVDARGWVGVAEWKHTIRAPSQRGLSKPDTMEGTSGHSSSSHSLSRWVGSGGNYSRISVTFYFLKEKKVSDKCSCFILGNVQFQVLVAGG